MINSFSYPFKIIQDGDQYIAQAIDIPEAVTFGDTVFEALHEAADALTVAISGYLDNKQELPAPSISTDKSYIVHVPPLICAKIALVVAMRESKISNVELGKRLDISEGAVRRMVNLDHKSHIESVESALESVGYRLITRIEKDIAL